MKIIRLILTVIVVVLAIAVVATESSNTAKLTPYMLIALGTLNIFNGAYLYKENKTTESIMMFLIGLFVIVVAFFIKFT